jgi:hypothetical protein
MIANVNFSDSLIEIDVHVVDIVLSFSDEQCLKKSKEFLESIEEPLTIDMVSFPFNGNIKLIKYKEIGEEIEEIQLLGFLYEFIKSVKVIVKKNAWYLEVYTEYGFIKTEDINFD